MRRSLIASCAAAACIGGLALAGAPGAEAAGVGTLDQSWGTAGKTLVTFNPGGDDEARAVVTQSDGAVVIAGKVFDGAGVPHMGVARLDSSGALDPAFDGTGRAVAPSFMAASNGDQANAVAVQSDGKIVIAGPVSDSTGAGGFGVARFDTDGSPDSNFGTAGESFVQVGPDGADDVANGVAVQPDGAIVVVGTWSGGWAVARFTALGALDANFNAGGPQPGVQAFSLGDAVADSANAVAIQQIGASGFGIVVAGSAAHAPGDGLFQEDFGVVRLTSSGAFDTSFGGGDGIATVNAGGNIDSATSEVIQPDGAIVIAGLGTAATFVVARLTADGTADASFGPRGKRVLPVDTSGSAQLSGLALGPAGQIYAGGMQTVGRGDAFVARLATDGTLDPSFGVGGVTHTNEINFGSVDRLAGLSVDGLGRVVAVGSAEADGASQWFANRYYTNPAPVLVTPPVGAISCGGDATFSVEAAGQGPYTYQWQVHSPSNTTWTNLTDDADHLVTGSHGPTLTLAAAGLETLDTGDKVRVLVTGPGGSTASLGVTLRVGTKPIVTLDPVDTAPSGDNVFHFTAAGTGSPDPTVQWFLKTPTGTWQPFSGATTTELNLVSFGTEFGDQVKARFRNFCGATDSAVATAEMPG